MEETVAVRRRPDRQVVVALFALMASMASWSAFTASPAAADDPTTTTTTLPSADPAPTTSPETTSPETTTPPGATDPGPLPPRTGPPPLPGQPPLPPDLKLPDPTPHIRLLAAQITTMETQRWQGIAAFALEGAKHAQADTDAAVTEAEATVGAADHDIDNSRDQLGSLAVLAYMGSGDAVLSAVLKGDSTAAARQRELLNSSLDSRKQDLRDAQRQLVDANTALDAARQAAADAAQKVNDAQAGVDDLAAKLVDARKEEANARANRSGWQLTIEGANLATAEELSAWFAGQNHPSRANAPLDDLTGWFITEGTTEGIRGDMAFAQALVETGYFANPDTVNGNNFAGIGHCDTCPSGFAFKDVQSGVRGQIQLLKSYAQHKPEYTYPLVDSRLRGPAGCCQNWTELTHVWASDPNYGPVILGVYEKLLTYVVMTRTANGGQPPRPRTPPTGSTSTP